MSAFFLALLGAALVNNLLVLLPAGADAVAARPARMAQLGRMSAVLIALATPLGWLLFHGVLQPLNLDFLRLFLYAPMLAALAWLTVSVFRRSERAHEASPLFISSAAALASILLAEPRTFALAVAQGVGGGLGFLLALQMLGDLLGRIDHDAVPVAFRGGPLLLISAGLIGLVLLGLQGLAPL